MSAPATLDSGQTSTQSASSDFSQAEDALLHSPRTNLITALGLPLLGILFTATIGLPAYVIMFASGFLMATGMIAVRAIVTFVGKTLKLLVACRLVIVGILGALLMCVTAPLWPILISAVVLWLVAEKLLGKRALLGLWKRMRR